MAPTHGPILEELAIAAAELATYCDHVEHAESADPAQLLHTAQRLLEAAVILARFESMDPIEAYARRLDSIEAASAVADNGGGQAARQAGSWRKLQLVQVEHDRRFHPDVVGMARADQLRHYAFHLSKLAGAVARRIRGDAEEELRERRLADTFLFAIKLWTATGHRLPDAPLRDATGALMLPDRS